MPLDFSCLGKPAVVLPEKTWVYTCTEHTPAIVDGYFEALDPIFGLIRECEDGRGVLSLLKGPIAHSGFTRLN